MPPYIIRMAKLEKLSWLQQNNDQANKCIFLYSKKNRLFITELNNPTQFHTFRDHSNSTAIIGKA